MIDTKGWRGDERVVVACRTLGQRDRVFLREVRRLRTVRWVPKKRKGSTSSRKGSTFSRKGSTSSRKPRIAYVPQDIRTKAEALGLSDEMKRRLGICT